MMITLKQISEKLNISIETIWQINRLSERYIWKYHQDTYQRILRYKQEHDLENIEWKELIYL